MREWREKEIHLRHEESETSFGFEENAGRKSGQTEKENIINKNTDPTTKKERKMLD